MENRIASVKEAKEIIADFHGRRIRVFNNSYEDSHGNFKWQSFPIIRIIPMHYPKKNQIDDVEILLNKTKNTYFSIGMILKNKSWVKNLEIGDIDFKAKSQKVLWPFPKDDETWIRTARYIKLLRMKITR